MRPSAVVSGTPGAISSKTYNPFMVTSPPPPNDTAAAPRSMTNAPARRRRMLKRYVGEEIKEAMAQRSGGLQRCASWVSVALYHRTDVRRACANVSSHLAFCPLICEFYLRVGFVNQRDYRQTRLTI